jgi:putative endonuclease
MISKEHGERGEQIATEWLREHGYEICDRNWRSGRYELDIVASRFDVLHFIEVKCRGEESYLAPEETLNATKRRALTRAVAAYLALHDSDLNPQIDLLAITIANDNTHTIEYFPEAVIPRW